MEAEEVEEERVGEKRESEDKVEQGKVVDSDVGEVLADLGGGLSEGIRSVHGGTVKDL